MKSATPIGDFVIKVETVGTVRADQYPVISMARRIALCLTYSESFLFKNSYNINVDGKGDIYITEVKGEKEMKEEKDFCTKCEEGEMGHHECDNFACFECGCLVECDHECYEEGEDYDE